MTKQTSLDNGNILVTGGAGFIGSHLVEELLKRKVNVFVVDIEVKPLSYFVINKLNKKVKFELIDVRDKNKIFRFLKKYKPDFIFHLAAITTVTQAYEDPYKTIETNVMGTANILEAVRLNSFIKGVIVASSDKAYGKTEKRYTENFPLKGDHPYEVSKASADLISQAYYKTYKTPVVVTRFGNVYGEGDSHFDRIIPGICEAVIKNKPLLIRSNGQYIRDYLYVKDVANGYLTLLENIDKIHGEAFNFASSDNLSVLELIKLAERTLKTTIPFKILNTARNEIPYQHLDFSKVKKLGWTPKTTLKEGLKKTYQWFKKNYE